MQSDSGISRRSGLGVRLRVLISSLRRLNLWVREKGGRATKQPHPMPPTEANLKILVSDGKFHALFCRFTTLQKQNFFHHDTLSKDREHTSTATPHAHLNTDFSPSSTRHLLRISPPNSNRATPSAERNSRPNSYHIALPPR